MLRCSLRCCSEAFEASSTEDEKRRGEMWGRGGGQDMRGEESRRLASYREDFPQTKELTKTRDPYPPSAVSLLVCLCSLARRLPLVDWD